jgi:hypothetical protein
MKMVHFGEFGRKMTQIVAAALLAAIVSTTPVVLDVLMDADTVPTATAGRPQSGCGEC